MEETWEEAGSLTVVQVGGLFPRHTRSATHRGANQGKRFLKIFIHNNWLRLDPKKKTIALHSSIRNVISELKFWNSEILFPSTMHFNFKCGWGLRNEQNEALLSHRAYKILAIGYKVKYKNSWLIKPYKYWRKNGHQWTKRVSFGYSYFSMSAPFWIWGIFFASRWDYYPRCSQLVLCQLTGHYPITNHWSIGFKRCGVQIIKWKRITTKPKKKSSRLASYMYQPPTHPVILFAAYNLILIRDEMSYLGYFASFGDWWCCNANWSPIKQVECFPTPGALVQFSAPGQFWTRLPYHIIIIDVLSLTPSSICLYNNVIRNFTSCINLTCHFLS